MSRSAALLAPFSALLFAASQPNELFPYGQTILGLISIVPYFLALSRARTVRQAVYTGMLFGGLSTALTHYWLMFFGDFSVWTLGGVTVAYIGFHAFLAPIIARFCDIRLPYRPFALAVVWTGYEYLKSVGFLGFPWGLVAYPVHEIEPLIQHVEITGIWSLSFLMALVNALLFEALSSRRLRSIAAPTGVAAAICIAMLGFGWLRLSHPLPVERYADLLLVQQNSDPWNDDPERALETAQRLTRQSLSSAGATAPQGKPDLVIWSETSLRYPYRHSRAYYDREPSAEPFSAFLSSLPAPLLTGAPYVKDTDTLLNAAILLQPDGELTQFYGKRQLVPFAEHIPFWELSAVRTFFRNVVGVQGVWTPGESYRLFDVPLHGDGGAAGTTGETGTQRVGRMKVATPICFEDSFGNVVRGFARRGADLFVNLTNNSWSRSESAQIQHFVAARFRTIETRTALVRSTNSGLTGVVDGFGRLSVSVPMFEEAFLHAKAPIYEMGASTVYVRFGDYLGRLAVIGAVAIAAYLRLRRPMKGCTPTL